MKKLICIVCCVVLVASMAAAFVGCQKVPRDRLLKIYLPGEYMDYDIFEGFETWYEEQTGKEITVEYKEFENVEDIQLAVEGSKSDYDLLCPSDYMVEYLISKELLLPVDKDILDIEEEGLFRSEYIKTTKQFDDKLTYAVPYMYGTLGLVYNRKKTGAEVTSWSALFGGQYNGTNTLSIKKSIRDAYCAACLYNARDQLVGLTGDEQKAAVQEIFEKTDAATVQAAKDTLTRAKGSAVWDNDDVKYEMASNSNDVKVALMWSCDAGYVMNDYEENGENHKGNRDLWYVVPEEGGNVYIDCFVISKYAKNVTAAQYFLAYLCQQEIAVQNSEYAGAISPVAAAYDELYTYYTEDEDGIFEGTDEGWKEMFIDTMFPSAETLNRCGVMKDFGEGKNAVTKMWQSIVK